MNAQHLVSFLYQRDAVLTVEDGDLLIDAPDEVLNEDLLVRIRQNKAGIIALLTSLDAEMTVSAVAPKGDYPLTYECAASLAQQRMLFMEAMAGNSSYYNIPTAYQLTGPLNKPALRKSLARLVAAHDVLRSVYVQSEHVYVQRICDPAAFQLIEKKLSGQENQDEILSALLAQEAEYRFDLEHEWPIRMSLIEMNDESYVLSINIHHIAADGWSAGKILSDIGNAYSLFANQANYISSVIEIERDYQYADYVIWQETWKTSRQFLEAKKYWVKTLKGMPQLHGVPTDCARPNLQTVVGDTYTHTMTGQLCSVLEQRAREYKTTPFVIFQSIFAALLARYSGEADIVFGTAVANRQPLEFMDTVGLFVNTIILRYPVEDQSSFADLIRRAKEVSDGAMRHQQFPFDGLVDELQPTRSPGYSPLVQIMLVMQEDTAAALELDGIATVQLTQRQDVAKFDIALHVCAASDKIQYNWEYNTSLFRLESIQAMATHFERLLEACLFSPEKAIGSLALVNATSLDAAIDAAAFPAPSCIHQLFEAQVARSPGSVALRTGSGTLSYQELNERANQVAAHLYRASAGTVGRIGLCVEKSADLIIGLLAILKVGAVYVPLDPYYPKERLEFMIQDAGLQILLSNTRTKLPEGLEASTKILLVDALDGDTPSPHPTVTDVNLPAYIIYTSGSTGKPKGVLVSHKALFYSLQANQALMGIAPDDVMPTIGSQAFGVSLLEILLPLVSGGAVQVLSKADIADIEKLVEVSNQVTVLHAVPSLMHQWLDAVVLANRPDQYPDLRLLLVGGEAVPDGLLKKIKQWRPEVRLLELYGMTESAVVCCSYEAGASSSAHYCIGKAHPNSHFYVLNRQCQQQPLGVPGELHIGGLSIATEYINQAQMTAERFIDSPFAAGERLYKTGDLVRHLADGNFEFIGRIDHQVKIRGFRIELGEIESQLVLDAEVGSAVVMAREDAPGEKRLVAYITQKEGRTSEGAEHKDKQALVARLRSSLQTVLPDYMVPALYVILDEIPLTPNGKIDKKALPVPDASLSQVEYVAPRSETEKRLVEIWLKVLKFDKLGITDNFFSLGGHSLLATQLQSNIKSVFQKEIKVRDIFEHPTIVSMAQCLDQLETVSIRQIPKLEVKAYYNTSFKQKEEWVYNRMSMASNKASWCSQDRMEIPAFDIRLVEQSLSLLINRHEILRTTLHFIDGSLQQKIHGPVVYSAFADLIDLRQLNEPEYAIQQIEEQQQNQFFDFSVLFLFSVKIVMTQFTNYFIFTMDHSLADRQFALTLQSEFGQIYQSLLKNEALALAPISVCYKDYAEWEFEEIFGHKGTLHREYWHQLVGAEHRPALSRHFSDHNPPLIDSYKDFIAHQLSQAMLPLDPNVIAAIYGSVVMLENAKDKPPVGKQYVVPIRDDIFLSLQRASVETSTSLSTLMLSALSILLHQLSGIEKIVIVTLTGTRVMDQLTQVGGAMTNNIFSVNHFKDGLTFDELIHATKMQMYESDEHKIYPFAKLLHELDVSVEGLGTAFFNFISAYSDEELPLLDGAHKEGMLCSEIDLNIIMRCYKDGIYVDCQYRSDLFDAETIVSIMETFLCIVKKIGQKRDGKIADFWQEISPAKEIKFLHP